MTKPAIGYIGFPLETTETSWSSVIIFGCLFADMIIIPLIIGMNLIEFVGLDFLKNFQILNGKNTDFGALWYTDIGR